MHANLHVCFVPMYVKAYTVCICIYATAACMCVCFCAGYSPGIVHNRRVSLLLHLQGYVPFFFLLFGTSPVEADCLDPVQREEKDSNKSMFGLKHNAQSQFGRCRLN